MGATRATRSDDKAHSLQVHVMDGDGASQGGAAGTAAVPYADGNALSGRLSSAASALLARENDSRSSLSQGGHSPSRALSGVRRRLRGASRSASSENSGTSSEVCHASPCLHTSAHPSTRGRG